ncbi:hypothetical protein M409DRAFT_55075 [Zasmidium cellare ATCC 36951]|uniref:Uncharacterized protein n=1 Tax=Zasmidium cellare ATCC 36951 TaxID=1080233 RepID=A0A6A6CGM5_ZASCE|nr:uncharacterized protein M409DRAFT_55075 [Zasmidium cellare ATCC 36951]KAF2166211.1 hypothetical protein M409DRAFT_55075 [Zasmidium cellare ATCC 36951]
MYHASKAHHSCSMPDEENAMQVSPVPIVCPCFGRAFPAVLRANRLIYKEAMPVFYSNLEVRSRLPDENEGHQASEVLNFVCYRLPYSGLKYVSKILFCQVASRMGMTIDRLDKPGLGNFAPIWHRMRRETPGIKHVRIQLEVDWEVDMDCFEFHHFAGVARLPNVRTIQLQLLYFGNEDVLLEDIVTGGGKAEDFEKKLVSTIEEEAEKEGKRVDVSVSGVEMLWNHGWPDSNAID